MLRHILAPILWPISLALVIVQVLAKGAALGGLVAFLVLSPYQALTLTTFAGALAVGAGMLRAQLHA